MAVCNGIERGVTHQAEHGSGTVEHRVEPCIEHGVTLRVEHCVGLHGEESAGCGDERRVDHRAALRVVMT